MAEKKYQVFISSTYDDLKEERRKILDVLLMADCIPAGMEAFVATDDEQFSVIKKVIDLCDYYILIIGKRYGSINPQTQLSYTEMEYDYAKANNIPVLVFAIDEAVNLPAEKVETDPVKIQRLSSFRTEAMTNRLASIWKTSDELTMQVGIAIMRAKSEIVRPGWQRATDFDEAQLRREMMALQSKVNRMTATLAEKEEALRAFTEQSDIAFEDCPIEIKAHTTRTHIAAGGRRESQRINASATVGLKEIFTVIATELMNVGKTEQGIESAIKSQLVDGATLDDNQFTKRILNQCKALGLLTSSWSEEKKALFWHLTKRGEKVRDDAILIRKQ